MYQQLQHKIDLLHDRIEQTKDAPSLSLLTMRGKRVFVVLGIPGCGKSVFLDKFCKILDAPSLHMRDFASKKGVQEETLQKASRDGRLLEGLDGEFLTQITSHRSEIIFLDGFPRSPSQAENLVTRARDEGWELQTIFLQLHEKREVAQSFERQRCRSARAGGDADVEEARAAAKIERYSENDGAALLALLNHGVPLHKFNATQGTSKLIRDVRVKLGVDHEALKWDLDFLRSIELLEKRHQVTLWTRGELICRAFWNAIYDREFPTQEIEVLCGDANITKKIRGEISDKRVRVVPWHGANPRSTPPLNQALYRCLHAAVRMEEGRVQPIFGVGAEADLWLGRVLPTEGSRPEGQLAFVKRCSEDYPLFVEETKRAPTKEPFKIRPNVASGTLRRFRL